MADEHLLPLCDAMRGLVVVDEAHGPATRQAQDQAEGGGGR